MLLALLKLGDIGARSLFILIVLYSLPVESSGQFGLIMTIVAFWSFFSGFERYLDIQRRLASEGESAPDIVVLDNMRFYGFNLLLLLPLVAVLLVYWVGLGHLYIALIPLIAIAEHQSAEIYRYALIIPRYRALLWIVLIRGVFLLGSIAAPVFIMDTTLTLDGVIVLWASVSVVFLLIGFAGFVMQSDHLRLADMPPFLSGLMARFSASKVHFWIGLMALLSLQADRLIVGSLLSLEQTGIYFRHVFLAMSLYQVFTVISYNRILSRVYRAIKAGDHAGSRMTIRAEVWRILALTVFMLVVAAVASTIGDIQMPAAQKLFPTILGTLLLAIMFRVLADYNAIVLNAFHRERFIFRAQGVSLAISAILNISLTWSYGLTGTVVSVLFGAIIYFIKTQVYARRSYRIAEEYK